jgi:membrane protease subunit HflK
MKNAPRIIALVVAAVIALWLASGFFMVREGDRAVVTTFGKFDGVRTPGLNWRMPYPIQRDEIVHFSQIRSVDVGGDSVIKNTGLRESGMLTEDENIIEAKFSVQYRLNNARDYLFDTKDPDTAVVQVAESAVREVVGKMTMDTALAEGRDQIAPRIRNLMQSILDRYKVGIDVVAVNMQQGGTRPPEQVQDAFDDVLKAGQEAERTKNEAQAYANNVVPRAKGTAARLTQEAEGYRARVVAQAQGDSQRFLSILPQYEKAPKVTRDRMYIDAMQNIYSGVNKIIIDSRAGGNLLYLPLDKLMAAAGEGAGNAKSTKPDTETPATPSSVPTKPTTDTDSTAGSGRSRSDSRTRFSDFR